MITLYLKGDPYQNRTCKLTLPTDKEDQIERVMKKCNLDPAKDKGQRCIISRVVSTLDVQRLFGKRPCLEQLQTLDTLCKSIIALNQITGSLVEEWNCRPYGVDNPEIKQQLLVVESGLTHVNDLLDCQFAERNSAQEASVRAAYASLLNRNTEEPDDTGPADHLQM